VRELIVDHELAGHGMTDLHAGLPRKRLEHCAMCGENAGGADGPDLVKALHQIQGLGDRQILLIGMIADRVRQISCRKDLIVLTHPVENSAPHGRGFGPTPQPSVSCYLHTPARTAHSLGVEKPVYVKHDGQTVFVQTACMICAAPGETRGRADHKARRSLVAEPHGKPARLAVLLFGDDTAAHEMHYGLDSALRFEVVKEHGVVLGEVAFDAGK
jgi:hypothetical protein